MTNPSEAHSLRDRLRRARTAAMKERDTAAVTVLRTSLGAIDNAGAVTVAVPPRPGGWSGAAAVSGSIAGAVAGHGAGDVPRRQLSEAQVRAIVRREVAEREQAAHDLDRLGRADEARRRRAEASLLQGLLDGG